MMTIKALGKYGAGGGALAGYLLGQSETTQTDYYLKGAGDQGEPAGRWHGRAAAQLGLAGGVMPAQLHGLMQGFDPRTYDPGAAKNAGLAERPGPHNRSGVDCTFTAPKSVSIVWALETPENRQRIEAAFHAAVNTALARLEDEVVTRRNHGGKDAEPVEGLFMAVFEHGTARVPKMSAGQTALADPHLHAHAIIANVCLRKDGSFGTIVNDSLYDNQKLLGAMFRGAFCEKLREIGYAIEPGKSDTFEIAGISEPLRDEFSKRNKRLHEWLAAHRTELAAKGITGKQAEDYAWRQTRSTKDSVNRPALFAAWQADAARGWDFDASKLAGLKGTVARLFNPPPPITVSGILAELTARNSVFALKDIETKLWHARQHYDFDVKAMLQTIIDSDQVVLLKDDAGRLFLTTTELHAMEQEIARLAVAGQSDQTHRTAAEPTATIVTAFAASSRAKAAREGWVFNEAIWTKQRAAIEQITQRTGRFAVLKGYAGAGKTTVMTCVRQCYEAQGFVVLGAALAGKAAENLQKEAGIKSDTLLGMLTRIEHGHLQLTAKNVVVIDEAGMVDSRLMHRVMTACAASGAKLITLGEQEQLSAIQAGGPFGLLTRILGHEAAGGIAVLDDITRQKADFKWLTTAILDLRRGEAEPALQALAAHDLLHIAPTAEAVQAKMVADWFADQAGYKQKLMIAGTRAETGDLNAIARATRRTAGELHGADVAIEVAAGTGGATVVKSFAMGDRIVFGAKDKTLGADPAAKPTATGSGVQNGYYGTIEQIKPAIFGRSAVLTVRLDDGRRIVFDTATQTSYVPPAARRFNGGQMFQTTQYNAIDHAYAITVHKSQGQTVERCYVMASDRMTDREWGYVALSRSKGATALYATSEQRESLAANLSRSRMKGTSLDYAAVDLADFRAAGGATDIDALIAAAPSGRFDRKIATLTQAITWGGAADIDALLADPLRRAEINRADERGNTPLHLACYKKNAAAVRALLAAGATVDAANVMGITPLMDATRSGDPAIVAALMEQGADAFRVAKNGDTAARFAHDLAQRAAADVAAASERADALRRARKTAKEPSRIDAIARDLAGVMTACHNAGREQTIAVAMVGAMAKPATERQRIAAAEPVPASVVAVSAVEGRGAASSPMPNPPMKAAGRDLGLER